MATVTLKACKEAMEASKNQAPTPDNARKFQELLAVAVQVLMPPVRGKPFETLQLTDSGNNSV